VRVSHRNLETLRVDPSRILKPRQGGNGRNPTNALWQAIKAFHDQGRLHAHDLLEGRLAALGVVDETYGDQLDAYIASYEAQGNTSFSTWQNADLPLGASVTLGGRIDRLDVRTEGGYAGWLFATKPKPLKWRGRLSMPLLQYEIATALGVSTDEVSVGFYWVDRDAYDEQRFTRAQIDDARQESAQLAQRIADLLGLAGAPNP
jgi:hypothetical protein